MFSGMAVLVEPAPYDALFLVVLAIGLLFSHLRLPEKVLFPILFLEVFLGANLISLLFSESSAPESIRFFGITLYLMVTWAFFCGLLNRYGNKAADLVVSSYLVSGAAAALTGIGAYFRLIPFADLFIKCSRVAGLFKDPNVYGPFLVPPALLALEKLESRHSAAQKTAWLGMFVLITSGVLLSFSRAAWANLLTALLVYFALPHRRPRSRKATAALMLAVGLPAIVLMISTPQVKSLLQFRVGLQDYDHTRFAIHAEAILEASRQPLGLGPGQSEIVFQYAAHSLFIRVMAENGLLGIASWLLFLGVTVVRALKNAFDRCEDPRPYVKAVAASLLGLLLNSIVVDTLHWRHFWIILAFPWIDKGGHRSENMPYNHTFR